jgi:hypothetical protein
MALKVTAGAYDTISPPTGFDLIQLLVCDPALNRDGPLQGFVLN